LTIAPDSESPDPRPVVYTPPAGWDIAIPVAPRRQPLTRKTSHCEFVYTKPRLPVGTRHCRRRTVPTLGDGARCWWETARLLPRLGAARTALDGAAAARAPLGQRSVRSSFGGGPLAAAVLNARPPRAATQQHSNLRQPSFASSSLPPQLSSSDSDEAAVLHEQQLQSLHPPDTANDPLSPVSIGYSSRAWPCIRSVSSTL
jgi:hypothetical protein